VRSVATNAKESLSRDRLKLVMPPRPPAAALDSTPPSTRTSRPPPQPAPLMKGIGFANVKRYVLSQHDSQHWENTLALLNPADRRVVESAVAVGWYDVLVFARLIRAIDKACGSGNLDLLRQIGAFEVEQDLNRVLRLFLRILSPANIFLAEGKIWSHFQSAGRWTSIQVPGGVDATLTGWAIDTALCKELAGYLEKLLQCAGAQAPHVGHTECQALGAPSCVFRYRWK